MSIWVLFDLDGTLVDNSEGITKSTQFALDSYGYPNQPMETLKKFIGPPLHESFMEFYGFSKEQAFEAVDRYRVRYKEKGVYENRLYPGMKELLEALKGVGVKLSVSTSKPTVFTEKILKQNGIFELFDQIVGVVRLACGTQRRAPFRGQSAAHFAHHYHDGLTCRARRAQSLERFPADGCELRHSARH